jgi:hypothetical protein
MWGFFLAQARQMRRVLDPHVASTAPAPWRTTQPQSMRHAAIPVSLQIVVSARLPQRHSGNSLSEILADPKRTLRTNSCTRNYSAFLMYKMRHARNWISIAAVVATTSGD